MTAITKMSRWVLGFQIWLSDVRNGFVAVTRHSLALFGLAVVITGMTFSALPNLQASASDALLGWVEVQQIKNLNVTPANNAAERTMAADLGSLTPEQAAVSKWLSRRYRVSTEAMAALVAESGALGERSQLPPNLILAIMAIESRFNPFASGSQGIVGLMQIEIGAHDESLSQFGGPLSAFDPLTNLRIGVRQLQALTQETDTLEEALELYAATTGVSTSQGYVERILAEQKLLDKISAQPQAPALATNKKRVPN